MSLFKNTTTNQQLKIKALLYGHQDFIRTVQVYPPQFNNNSGGQVITGSNDHTVRTWTISGSEGICDRILMGHDSTVTCLSVLKRNVIVSGSADHSIRIWDTRNASGMECVGKFQHLSVVNDLTCWSDLINDNDGDELINTHDKEYLIYSVGQDSKLNVWDIRKLSDCSTDNSVCSGAQMVDSYSFDIMSGSYSSFGGYSSYNFNSTATTGTTYSQNNNNIDKTNFENCKIKSISTNFGRPLCCHVGRINHRPVIFVGSTNGTLLALSLSDNSHDDSNSYTVVRRFNGHYSDITCLSAENDILVSGDDSGHVKIFSLKQQLFERSEEEEEEPQQLQQQPIVSLNDHSDRVTCCQVIDSHVYSGSMDGTIHQYSFNHDSTDSSQNMSVTGTSSSTTLLRTIERLSMQVFSLSVSKDLHLYCASDEEALRCWDLNNL